MATRRDGLARRRAAMGFTQETLAEHLGLERSTVGRWERGTGTPQPWNQPDLAKALGVSHDVLVDLLEPDHLLDADHAPGRLDARDVARSLVDDFSWPDWHRTGQASVLEPPWSATGTVQVLHEIAGGGMDRRGFLTITGGALVGLAGHWGSALVNAPTTLPEDRQGHLPVAVLDRIDSRLAEASPT